MAGNYPIVLTDEEQKIFKLLLEVERHYNLQTEVRVAGGWVRDKLLGKESKDIDVALFEMYGKDFCKKINEYLSSIGEGEKTGRLIPANSEKSVDLETGKMQLDGISIDFVNLRTETYNAYSRIPTKTEFANANDDALRRDLTVNSLFYNITRGTVEDFTGRGIDDLNNGRIVTTLPPQVSFIQDPLRVFRAIRFGARFGFVLDEELKTAAKSAEVKAAIAIKLNKELISREVNLMISGKDPVTAMTYICELSLYSVIFTSPSKCELTSLQGIDRLCTKNMDAVANIIKSPDCYEFNDGDKRLTFYAALLLPLRKFTYTDETPEKILLVDYILRYSLKLPKSDAESVMMIHNAAEKFANLIPYLIYGKSMDTFKVVWGKENIDIPSTSKLRVYAGLLLDEIKSKTKRLPQISFWRISLLVSTLLYSPSTIDWAEWTNGNIYLNEKKHLFTRAEKEILKLGIEEVAHGHLKPLVDGNVIKSALRLKSSSPVVGTWVMKVRVWQLANPNATKEECIEWIKENSFL